MNAFRSHRSWRAILLLLAVSLVAPVASSATTGQGSQPVAGTAGPATPSGTTTLGTVTAHDGKFWVDNQPILLRGTTIIPTCCGDPSFQQIATWKANFIRIRVIWSFLEPTPPTQDQTGAWIHTWDQAYADSIVADIRRAANNGMWTLIDNHPNWLSAFRYPDWQYTAPYNSHDKDYPATLEGSQEAETDFWTDDLRQQFVDEMWRYLAALVGDEPGVAGYAPMSEPEPGNLPYVHTTTATILDWQAKQSLSIRAVDPDAIIFFTTRNGFGPGLPTADLSDYTAMGNVAFDLHDYFGARLGSGLGPTDPASPNYMEGRQAIYAASDDGSGNEHPYAYTGTVDSQIRFLKSHMKYLKPLGIPMYVGEFTTDGSVDPGVFLFHGTVTSALNQLSLSWTVSNYWGPLGVVSAPGGPLNPWGCILVEAMGGTC